MSLIDQRNRFLSFAFASADVLIETDSSGETIYAAGAIGALGNPAIDESKGNLAERLDPTSRPIFKALLRTIKPGRRAGPARITINNREAHLSGWALGTDDLVRWTLSFSALNAPEEVEPQAFERSAASAVTSAREAGKPLSMSVMLVSGIDDLEREIGPDKARQLNDAIAAASTIAVGDLGVARQVDNNRTALIHPADADLKALKGDVEAALAQFSLTDATVSIDSIPDAPDLEPEIAVQAFLHAVNEAANSDIALDVDSLQDVARGMMETTKQRMRELRTTIAGRVIEPHAQPVVDLNTGELSHFELLLRLPGGKPISESVLFAESTGLIYDIDFAMTEIAISYLAEDFDRPALAVNLSGKSLSNTNWATKFLNMLALAKIDRKRLAFELTETATVKNIKAVNNVIAKIRERGHKVCLDDFGAGSAGFHYLRDFPADVVKIDGSYIRRATRSDRDMTILKSMVELCIGLETKVVAEMIEDKASAERLKAMGVHYGQGYYFGKPVPLKSLTDPKNVVIRAA